MFNKFIEKPAMTLAQRKWRQRLTFLEKSFIYKEGKQKHFTPSEISSKYGIWKSTVYSIIKEFMYPTSWMFSLWGRSSRILCSSRGINHYVQKYWDMQTNPYVLKDVSAHMKEKFRIKLNDKFYARIMKENLSLIYKKGKSWPVGLDRRKADLLKWLFAISIIPRLSDFEMVINVDESSFSRTTKLAHSWLKKGKPIKLNNIWYSSSTSLITAITSKGNAFAANTDGSVNSSIFLEFLKRLWWFIEEECRTKIDKCLFILDNAATHRSNNVIKYWQNRRISIAFIPPYTPELAPIEKYFSILKNMILRQTIGEWMSWQSTRASKVIRSWILRIEKKTVQKLWLTFTYELKEAIEIIDKTI